jgi:hypothetical protein
MYWYVKKIKEEGDLVYVGWSEPIESKEPLCDGEIIYNKKDCTFIVSKVSVTSEEYMGRWCGGHLHNLIRDNKLTEKVRVIAIG